MGGPGRANAQVNLDNILEIERLQNALDAAIKTRDEAIEECAVVAERPCGDSIEDLITTAVAEKIRALKEPQ